MPPKRNSKPTAKPEILEFNTEDCVTFEAVLDQEYTLDLVCENLLRILCYEGPAGIGEFVSLILRSIGIQTLYTLDVNMLNVTKDLETIEDQCIESNKCPADYPLLKQSFQTRISQTLTLVTKTLVSSDQTEVLSKCISLLSEFAQFKIQSFRHAAVVFLAAIVACPAIDDSNFQTAIEILEERSNDIAVFIRKLAISTLISNNDLATVMSGLKDANSSLRLSMVRSLAANKKLDIGLPDLEKVAQVAIRDPEVNVRRAALRALVVHAEHTDLNLSVMLLDSDDVSRKLAAEFIVAQLIKNNGDALSLIEYLQQTSTSTDLVGECVAKIQNLQPGFLRFKTKLSGNLDLGIAEMLSTDYTKEMKKRSANKASLKAKSTYLADKNNLQLVLELLNSCIHNSKAVKHIPLILERVQFDDHLYALALTATAKLDIKSLLDDADTHKSLEIVMDSIKNALNERLSIEICSAASELFTKVPEFELQNFLTEFYQDLRISLADLLGPKGEPRDLDQFKRLATALQVVARFYNTSDLLRLPLWSLLTQGNEDMWGLVRAIGITGDEAAMTQILGKLEGIKTCKSADLTLQIHIAAKMRDIDSLPPLNLDLESTPPSPDLYTAAVAAGIV